MGATKSPSTPEIVSGNYNCERQGHVSLCIVYLVFMLVATRVFGRSYLRQGPLFLLPSARSSSAETYGTLLLSTRTP